MKRSNATLRMESEELSEKLESVARMGHIDRSFFGENGSGDGDEEELPRRTQEGLLDSEPDRAETDFFNGDKYVGDTADGKRHGQGPQLREGATSESNETETDPLPPNPEIYQHKIFFATPASFFIYVCGSSIMKFTSKKSIAATALFSCLPHFLEKLILNFRC